MVTKVKLYSPGMIITIYLRKSNFSFNCANKTNCQILANKIKQLCFYISINKTHYLNCFVFTVGHFVFLKFIFSYAKFSKATFHQRMLPKP